MPPVDWQPRDHVEELESVRRVLKLIVNESKSRSTKRSEAATAFIIKRLSVLLTRGHLDEIQQTLGVDRVDERIVPTVVTELDRFLSQKDRSTWNNRLAADGEYYDRVAIWRDAISPNNFSGRLRTLISRDMWDLRAGDVLDSGRGEIESLADEAYANPTQLLDELVWLSGPEARAAESLGHELGKRDVDVILCGPILTTATQTGCSGLARGYVRGLTGIHATQPAELESLMGTLERAHPAAAFEIHTAGGDFTNAVQRTVNLVRSGTLPARFLASFAWGIGNRQPTADEVREMSRLMLDAGDPESLRAGIRFLAHVSLHDTKHGNERLLEERRIRETAWEFVKRTADDPSNEGFEWSVVVRALAGTDPERAADLVAPLYVGGNTSMRDCFEDVLKELARTSPTLVLNAVGQSLLDPDTGRYGQIAVFDDLISELPAGDIIDWLEQNGVEGARCLVRHLPRPFISEAGTAVVPEVVEFMFTEFEYDDDLLRLYCSGHHESWCGNGAQLFQSHADDARRFLSHPLARIREWARFEVDYCESVARVEQREHAEKLVEF